MDSSPLVLTSLVPQLFTLTYFTDITFFSSFPFQLISSFFPLDCSFHLLRPIFALVMSTHSAENVAATSGSVLPVDTGIGIPQEILTTSEGAPVPAMVLQPEAVK